MKKSLAIVLAIGLLLPCCVRKKASEVSGKKDVAHAYGAHAGKSGTYDEDVGAFVLDDDADYDVFDSAKPVAAKKDAKAPEASKPVAGAPTSEAKTESTDDSWAWEELDEDQPTKSIQFEFDSAKINADQVAKLRYDADLAKYACEDGATVVVEGHSCLITRSQIYNQALSQRRADNVKKELVKHGVPNKCLKSVGRGTSQLLTRAESKMREESIKLQAPNRRVEVKFVYPK